MNCTSQIDHSLVKVEENRKKAVFNNELRFQFDISQVDGCLINDGVRCDKLVTKKGSASVLIELKGVDVKHATEQLFNSADNQKVRPLLEDSLGFLVVCSKYPRFDGFVAKAKQRAAKQYKAGFHVVTNEGVFDIERVAAIDGPY